MIYWITGRSGSGKTTLAGAMRSMFQDAGKTCVILDGDDVREYFPTGYTDYDRAVHLHRIASMAQLLEKQIDIVIIACISPIKKEREHFQSMFEICHEIYLEGGTMWEGTIYEEPDDIKRHQKVLSETEYLRADKDVRSEM